jgi:hypothetical protein
MDIRPNGILGQATMYVCTSVHLPEGRNVKMKIHNMLPYADSIGHWLCHWGRVCL